MPDHPPVPAELLELFYTWWLTDMSDSEFFNRFVACFPADQANDMYRRVYAEWPG